MVGQKALFTTIRLYGLQSLLLAIVATTMAISESRPELFVTAALTVVLKTILIPWFLMRTVDRIGIHREIEPFLNVPVSADLSRPDRGRVSGQHGLRRGCSASHPPSHRRGAVAALIGLFLMVTQEGHHADPGFTDCGERSLPGGRGRDHRHAAGRNSGSPSTSCSPSSSSAFLFSVSSAGSNHGRQPALKLEGIGVNLLSGHSSCLC